MRNLSVNMIALELVEDLVQKADKYRVIIKIGNKGTRIIDSGIEAEGGYLAGKIITEICMGGLGKVSLSQIMLKDLHFPSINIFTDHPAISTLGSQLAGWRISSSEYSAIISGPGRALALKPKSVYRRINYKDESNKAVLILETSREPPTHIIDLLSNRCHVNPENLILILVPTTSLVGAVQIVGRIVETGIHKLNELGFDPKCIQHASGQAPILPIHPDIVENMGRFNDAILYGGAVYCQVNFDEKANLQKLTSQSVSFSSKEYGKPFAEIYTEANFDFYKIDPAIFAPARITIHNIRTGHTFSAGKINQDMIIRSIGY